MFTTNFVSRISTEATKFISGIRWQIDCKNTRKIYNFL